MRRFSVIVLAVAIACLFLVGASAGGDLPRDISSQLRPAVEKLRQAYTHATISGTSAVAYPSKGKSRQQDFVMRANGEKRRLDVTTLQQQGLGLKIGTTEMRMATPDGSLITSKDPNSDFFDDATQVRYNEIVSAIDNRCLLNFPYSLDSSGTILDMLVKPGVKILGVKKIKADGDTLVQIDYEDTSKHEGHTGLWKSQLVLSPAEGWAVRGFTRTLTQGSHEVTQRAKLTYSGGDKGIPLVESIEFESTEGRTVVRKESIRVNDFKLGNPDDYYFTSFAF